jgi:tRNA threonylcarbamoyladenosine modification (KEOPS) complex Cgi121 subunit
LHKKKNKRNDEKIKVIHNYGEIKAMVKGFCLLDNKIRELYDALKANNKDTNIVIVNSNIVFGMEHILGIIKIINEEVKLETHREIKNFEVEFLLRICYTNQISNAFQILNDNKNNNIVCILFSKCLSNLQHAYADLKNYGKENDDLIHISEAKKLLIIELFLKKEIKDADMNFIKDNQKFQKLLIERSAISLK